MEIECVRCTRTLRGRSGKFRRYAKAQGWTNFIAYGCLYWLCWECPKSR